MPRDFNADDEGKSVMTADGDMVGTIQSAKGSRAEVTPDASLSKSVRRRLGWSEQGQDTYTLRKSKVDRIDDKGIHLKRNL